MLESSCCQLTYHRLQHTLGDFNELLVDLNGKVTQHLTVFSEVKVLKTVLILLGGVLSHEALQRERHALRPFCGLPAQQDSWASSHFCSVLVVGPYQALGIYDILHDPVMSHSKEDKTDREGIYFYYPKDRRVCQKME